MNKNSVRIQNNRLVPFIFDPERVNPQSVAARDVDELHIEMILSRRGRFTNKREKQNIFLASLPKVFERVRKCNVALKSKKCRLGLFEIEYVDCVISINGTTMRNLTINKVLNFP